MLLFMHTGTDDILQIATVRDSVDQFNFLVKPCYVKKNARIWWKPVKAVGTLLERHKLLLLSKYIKKLFWIKEHPEQ